MLNMKTLNTAINEENELVEIKSEFKVYDKEYVPVYKDLSSGDTYINIDVKENRRKKERNTGITTSSSASVFADGTELKRSRSAVAATESVKDCYVSLYRLPNTSVQYSVAHPFIKDSVLGDDPDFHFPGSTFSVPFSCNSLLETPYQNDKEKDKPAKEKTKRKRKKRNCPVCEMSFSGSVSRHMRRKHPNKYEAFGGSKWPQREANSNRRKSKNPPEEKKKCQICGLFVIKITRHIRTVHKDHDLSHLNWRKSAVEGINDSRSETASGKPTPEETALQEQNPKSSTKQASEPALTKNDVKNKHGRRAGFSEEDNAIFRKIFTRRLVPAKEMRMLIQENEDLRNLQKRAKERLGKEFSVKQLIDKIRVLKDD